MNPQGIIATHRAGIQDLLATDLLGTPSAQDLSLPFWIALRPGKDCVNKYRICYILFYPNTKQLETSASLVVTGATLVVTGALLVVTRSH